MVFEINKQKYISSHATPCNPVFARWTKSRFEYADCVLRHRTSAVPRSVHANGFVKWQKPKSLLGSSWTNVEMLACSMNSPLSCECWLQRDPNYVASRMTYVCNYVRHVNTALSWFHSSKGVLSHENIYPREIRTAAKFPFKVKWTYYPYIDS